MKHQQSNSELRLTEILFENRNKQYGAYVLRTESDRILTKAFFIGVGLLAAVSITPMLISAFKTAETPTDSGGFVLPPPIDVEIYNPPAEVLPPQAAPIVKSVKEFDSTVPTPTREADETNVVKDIPDDAVAGVKNDFTSPPAENTTVHINTPVISGTGKLPVIPAPEVKKDIDNTIKGAGELSVEAKFEGGIDSFRNKVMSKFDGSGFASEDVMKTTVTFIVERDGSISGLKADGKDADFNSEALRTIKLVKGKWSPGKNKAGEAVRSYFKFPISMKFEN